MARLTVPPDHDRRWPVGNTAYCNGCRCLACREKHRKARIVTNQFLVTRGRKDPDLIPHSTKGGYCNWGCRCPGCTEANKKACQAYRAKRRRNGNLALRTA